MSFPSSLNLIMQHFFSSIYSTVFVEEPLGFTLMRIRVSKHAFYPVHRGSDVRPYFWGSLRDKSMASSGLDEGGYIR